MLDRKRDLLKAPLGHPNASKPAANLGSIASEIGAEPAEQTSLLPRNDDAIHDEEQGHEVGYVKQPYQVIAFGDFGERVFANYP